MTPRLITLHEAYARFTPTGLVTPMEFANSLRSVAVECQAHQQTRLLVDTRGLEHRRLTTVDRFDISDTLSGFWDRSIFLSMLCREDQVDSDHFGQMVARNRGLFFGLSTDESAAIAWLSATPRPLGG